MFQKKGPSPCNAIECFHCRALRWCKSCVRIFSRKVAASQNHYHDYYCYYIYDNDDDDDDDDDAGVGDHGNKTTMIMTMTTIMYKIPILTLCTAALHHKNWRQSSCYKKRQSDQVRMQPLKTVSEQTRQTACIETNVRVTVPAREPRCVQEQKQRTSASSMG